MKYLKYAIKTELSNKSSFAVNIIATALVIYFILQYFGSYRGILSNDYEKSPYYILSSNIEEKISMEELQRLSKIKGFETARLNCGNIGGTPYGIALVGMVGRPYDGFMFGGTVAIENNTDTSSVYIPLSANNGKDGKEIGDTLILKKHKKSGIFFLSDNIEDAENTENAESEENNKENFEEVSFTIAGTFGDGFMAGNAFAFPAATALNHFEPTQAEIYLDVFELTEEEFNEDLEEIKNIFGNVANLSDFDKVIAHRVSSMRWQSVLFFGIGMICVMFMYSYILSRRVRRFSVCSLCGASKRDVTIITLIGCLLNYTVSFCLAFLLGKAVNGLFFEDRLGYDTMAVSLENGIMLYLLFLAVYLAVTAFYIVDFLRDSAVMVYRRSE